MAYGDVGVEQWPRWSTFFSISSSQRKLVNNDVNQKIITFFSEVQAQSTFTSTCKVNPNKEGKCCLSQCQCKQDESGNLISAECRNQDLRVLPIFDSGDSNDSKSQIKTLDFSSNNIQSIPKFAFKR